MNHCRSKRKFGRYSAHRVSMLKNIAVAIIREEQIKTTLAKAKEVRPVVEKMITMGKKGGLAVRRTLISMIGDVPEVEKVFSTLSARYSDRAGGYTRIVKTGYRKGDCAPVALISLVDARPEDRI